jgi:hypothetical protein
MFFLFTNKKSSHFDFVELVTLKRSSVLYLETKKVSKEPSPALMDELTNAVSKIQGCRPFWGSCFEACPRNTTRRFAPQTVLLGAGPRSKLQNIHYFPKCSEAI